MISRVECVSDYILRTNIQLTELLRKKDVADLSLFDDICQIAWETLEYRPGRPASLVRLQQREEVHRARYTSCHRQSSEPLCWKAAEYLIKILRKPFETSKSMSPFSQTMRVEDETEALLCGAYAGIGCISTEVTTCTATALSLQPRCPVVLPPVSRPRRNKT